MAEGMLPGCEAAIGSKPADEHDPLFNPLSGQAAGALHADGAIAAASVLGRIGGDPAALFELYRPEFDELARVVGGGASKQAWLREPIAVSSGKEDGLADITGPLRTASTLSEVFLLEYANGMNGKDLAWGRLDLAGVRRLMRLHEAYAELARRTPYVARARGSNLLSHILNSLHQAASGKAGAGAIGKPGDVALIIAGHDTNLSNLAGMMGLSWLLAGYEPNDPAPGGALAFELWQDAAKQFRVRMFYMAQSLAQMNGAVPLTLSAAPLRAAIFVPGCSGPAPDFECKWEDFRRVARAAIDPAFVPADAAAVR
jgi:4-phytase / acid phosphatase